LGVNCIGRDETDPRRDRRVETFRQHPRLVTDPEPRHGFGGQEDREVDVLGIDQRDDLAPGQAARPGSTMRYSTRPGPRRPDLQVGKDGVDLGDLRVGLRDRGARFAHALPAAVTPALAVSYATRRCSSSTGETIA
jgi:hypothetical protein